MRAVSGTILPMESFGGMLAASLDFNKTIGWHIESNETDEASIAV